MRHLAALALALALATSACGPGVTGYEVVHETRTATTGAFTVANAKCSAGNSLLGGRTFSQRSKHPATMKNRVRKSRSIGIIVF